MATVYAADLIVVGNRPSDLVQRIVYGSVRDEMVRASGVPVLVADAPEPVVRDRSRRP